MAAAADAQTAAAQAPPGPRIHVLQVLGNAIVGGMECWVERLVERLPRERFVVTALCPFESPLTARLRALGSEVLVTPMPPDPPWCSIQMATSLVQSSGIDLLHAHLPPAHLLAGIVGRLSARPVLTTVHGRQIGTPDLEVHRSTGTHLSVVCRQTYFQALALGVDAAQLSYDANGVDTERFRPRARGSGALRKALGLSPQVPLVGFVGRLSPEKGPEVFVHAAALLGGRCPGMHAVLVGEGPLEGELRRQIRRLGLQRRVHLAGLRDDMPQVYGDFDVLVSSSHTEAMPLALMEGMACGIANVATAVGGVPDIVEHGQTGWLVPGGDFAQIAERCAMLLEDAALRARMGARARERAVLQLNLTHSVERIGRLFTRLARPSGDALRRALRVVREPAGRASPAPRLDSA